MAKKILNVVEQGWRATLEEQDDPVLWLNAVLKTNGGDVTILLQGSAVGYLVKGQDASGLQFGARKQSRPPKIDEDVKALIGKGVPVAYVEDDLKERGIAPSELIEGATAWQRADVAKKLGDYDLVWTW
jgi:hypothetical protein